MAICFTKYVEILIQCPLYMLQKYLLPSCHLRLTVFTVILFLQVVNLMMLSPILTSETLTALFLSY